MRIVLKIPVAAAALFFFQSAAIGDSVDSLYQLATKSDNASAIAASNELMLLLDAEGITDSLIRFTHQTGHDERMKTIHLNLAAYYYANRTDMPATLVASRQATAAALLCNDTVTATEALAYQAVAASRMGQMDAALEATREELRLDSISRNIPNLARAYNTLAGLCLQAGALDDAERYVLRAYYIDGMQWDQIALKVPCAERTVYDIRLRGPLCRPLRHHPHFLPQNGAFGGT